MSQTIPLVSVEHCAHQCFCSPTKVLAEAAAGSALPGREHCAPTVGNQPDSQSLHSNPSQPQGHLNQHWDSFPLQMFLFLMALPPPMAQLRAELPELHVPNAPPVSQGKAQLLFPSEPKETLHCWELSCWKFVSCMFQAVSACKGKGTVFANRFHIVIQFSSLFGWSLFVWFSKSQWFKQKF